MSSSVSGAARRIAEHVPNDLPGGLRHHELPRSRDRGPLGARTPALSRRFFKPIEPPQPPRLPEPSTSISHSMAVSLAAFLSAPPGPEQDCRNDRPNDAPADPRDVWVSRLPFEDFLMDGH
jgi:hypothetical protein